MPNSPKCVFTNGCTSSQTSPPTPVARRGKAMEEKFSAFAIFANSFKEWFTSLRCALPGWPPCPDEGSCVKRLTTFCPSPFQCQALPVFGPCTLQWWRKSL